MITSIIAKLAYLVLCVYIQKHVFHNDMFISRTIAKVMRFKNVRFRFKLTWYSCYRNEVVTEFRGFLVI